MPDAATHDTPPTPLPIRYTRQEAFDIVVDHLLTQGVQSIEVHTCANGREDAECKYRQATPDGRILKCAIGALIPDDVYAAHAHMEGMGANGLVTGERGLPPILAVTDSTRPGDFLDTLQEIHDSTDVDKWPVALRAFARRFKLKVPARLWDA